MSNINSFFTLFLVLSGVLIFGIWTNINAYAQQPSSSPTSLSPASHIVTISSAVKAKMCAPGSPSLKVVNTTEARICGIPKTVKSNTTTAAAIPSTSTTAVSSPSTSPPTTTKLPATNVAAPKQQKTTTTPATSQLPKQTTGASKETTTAVRNVSDKPSLPSSPSTIAPQVNTVNKKHQQQEQLQPTTSNVTTGRNYTFATTSPAVTPSTLTYLGYQGSATSGGSTSSSSKDKHSSDTKSSSSHNDDSGKSSPSSIIKDDISSVIVKSFNFKHSRHSDSSDSKHEVSYFSDNSFDDNFPFISNQRTTVSASSSAIAGGASAAASASAGSG
jgi:hypothetical protein